MSGVNERRVRRDLRRLPQEDRDGAIAGLAIELAKRLDEGDASLRDLAALSAQFHAVMLTLAKKQEPPAVLDPVQQMADEVAARRARRIGRDAAASG